LLLGYATLSEKEIAAGVARLAAAYAAVAPGRGEPALQSRGEERKTDG
jgi:hypothetical protein